MAIPKAPVLGGKSGESISLEEGIFGAEVKPHLVHEAVRAELNAQRAATRGGKSRGLVAGGRGKPWRQKGTGRARAGTTRAPQWTGGGIAFPPTGRNFDVKVNRKAYRSALRGALSQHASAGTLAIVDPDWLDGPSTKEAVALVAEWGKEVPIVVVAEAGEENVIKSFRNLDRVLVLEPGEVEVAAVVWARALLVTRPALELLQRRAA